MNLLDRVMQHSGKPALRRAFGHDAVYTPVATGAGINTWLMPGTDLEYAGQFSQRAETRYIAQLPLSDIPEPQPGDGVVYSGHTRQVAQLIDNDGLFYKVALR